MQYDIGSLTVRVWKGLYFGTKAEALKKQLLSEGIPECRIHLVLEQCKKSPILKDLKVV
jgi:hypothetical protein